MQRDQQPLDLPARVIDAEHGVSRLAAAFSPRIARRPMAKAATLHPPSRGRNCDARVEERRKTSQSGAILDATARHSACMGTMYNARRATSAALRPSCDIR
jgi:hypothetical protein